jgi:hypothetical protein
MMEMQTIEEKMEAIDDRDFDHLERWSCEELMIALWFLNHTLGDISYAIDYWEGVSYLSMTRREQANYAWLMEQGDRVEWLIKKVRRELLRRVCRLPMKQPTFEEWSRDKWRHLFGFGVRIEGDHGDRHRDHERDRSRRDHERGDKDKSWKSEDRNRDEDRTDGYDENRDGYGDHGGQESDHHDKDKKKDNKKKGEGCGPY